MKLDPSRSRVAVYTFAEGLLSALAHDLEIVAMDVSGEADGDKAELRIAVGSLRVIGAMKRGRLDRDVLSASDRDAIEKQIRSEVLPGVEVVARGERAGGSASVELTVPRGKPARVSCKVHVSDEPGATADAQDAQSTRVRIKGTADVSLKAIGAPPVKGPMGAFRVSDKVRVDFDLVFS